MGGMELGDHLEDWEVDEDGNEIIRDEDMDHKIVRRYGNGNGSTWPVSQEIAADRAAAIKTLEAEGLGNQDEGTTTEQVSGGDDGIHADA